jgi:hypothetical protein
MGAAGQRCQGRPPRGGAHVCGTHAPAQVPVKLPETAGPTLAVTSHEAATRGARSPQPAHLLALVAGEEAAAAARRRAGAEDGGEGERERGLRRQKGSRQRASEESAQGDELRLHGQSKGLSWFKHPRVQVAPSVAAAHRRLHAAGAPGEHDLGQALPVAVDLGACARERGRGVPGEAHQQHAGARPPPCRRQAWPWSAQVPTTPSPILPSPASQQPRPPSAALTASVVMPLSRAVTSTGASEPSMVVPMPLVRTLAAPKLPCTWWPDVLRAWELRQRRGGG